MKLTSHLIKAVLVSAVLVVMAVPSFAGKDTVREMAQAMARVPATALPPESKTHRLKLSLRRLQPISEYLRNLPALFFMLPPPAFRRDVDVPDRPDPIQQIHPYKLI